MMRALRVAFLFTAYASLAWFANSVAALMADDSSDERVVRRIQVQSNPSDVNVDIDVDVQVRTSGACAFEVDRRVSLDLADGMSLEIDAGAGSLLVEGIGDATQVVAVGTACASSREMLDELLLTAETSDGVAMLSAHYPDRRRWRDGNREARIDLVVTVPSGLAVDIGDTSGEIEVRGTGDLRIADSSGSIAVAGVLGSVRIADSSGGIEVEDASGDVEITDGSGAIDVREVGRSVSVRDGSGGIEIENVGEDVLIEADGSGSIEVRDVLGDFVVERDGSGGIRYSGVAGRVDVPRRARR